MKKIVLSCSHEKVPLSRIDWEDRSFRLTYHRPLTALSRSIETIGLQNDPLVQRKEGGLFRMVSGFRRLQVLLRQGVPSLRCRTIPQATEEETLLFFNFQENLDRGFNAVEQAWAIKKLSPFMETEILISEILPLLGLPPQKAMLERCIRLTEISPLYWPFVLEGKLFPELFPDLLRHCRPLVATVLALFIQLRWSFQKQKEFLRDLLELAKRREESPETAFLTDPVFHLLAETRGTPQQKGEGLRTLFRKRLYPVLTETEKQFEEKRAAMELEGRTRLIPPPFFEGGVYRLEISFSDSDQLKASLNRISRTAAEGKLDDLP
jgi:hypothetical protein